MSWSIGTMILLLPLWATASLPEARVVRGQHAKVLSKMAGSAVVPGSAQDLQCSWSESSVEDGQQRCHFNDQRGQVRWLNGINASFVIDSMTGAKTASAVCREGRCRFDRAQNLNCFTLGVQHFGLQCRISASSAN